MFCPKCGAPNEDNAYRCARCNEVMQIVATFADKHGMGRAIFAIVTGALGTIGLVVFLVKR
jgi:L-serine deaminase